MGQRHQIYVVRKTEDGFSAIGAHHHQWCYGLTAASNLIRLIQAVNKTKTQFKEWSEYGLSDKREVDVVVKAVYGIDPESGHVSMVHDESEYLITDGLTARPERGDNNDGAALIVIDEIKKQVRGCLFTPGHVEGKYGDRAKKWDSWRPMEYAGFYYSEVEMEKTDEHWRRDLLDTEINHVTQDEFNKIFKASIGGSK